MAGNMVGRIRKDAQEISSPNAQVEAIQMLRFQGRHHDWHDVVDGLRQILELVLKEQMDANSHSGQL
jgi:hypothetical protein